MRLLLNNSDNETIIWTTEKGVVFEFRSVLGVLGSLDKLLKKLKIKLSDIDGLAVVVGQGRFTSTRVAVTVVNTLGYSLKIPVLAITGTEIDWLNHLSVQPIGMFVSAQYSAEANIGKKKV